MQNTLEKLLKSVTRISAEKTDFRDGIAVMVAADIYKNYSGDIKEKAGKVLIDKAFEMAESESVVSENIETMEYPSAYCALMHAYKIASDDEVKNKLKEKAVKLYKSETYMGLAFEMMHETLFGGKEHYHQITVDFKKISERTWQSETERALYFASLIQTTEAIDQPVYELYRALVDLFRKEFKAVLDEKNINVYNIDDVTVVFENKEAQFVFGCCVKKACMMKVLLAEKYEAFADRVIDVAAANLGTIGIDVVNPSKIEEEK